MTEERRIQLVAEVDATRTRAGFNEIAQQAGTMAASVNRAGEQAERSVSGIGTGAGRSAREVESAQRNLIGSIQRTTAAMEAGSRGSVEYYESMARIRNVPVDALRGYLNNLQEATSRQRSAAAAVDETRSAIERTAEAARVAAQAQREMAQAQAGREAFLGSLREQIALYGRSADEVLRYRAAQAGATESAAPLIRQLQNVRAAHEQIAEAARAESAARREAMAVQNGQTSFLAGLEQQAAAIGRTRSELLELQAAQMGVATQAAPFIARLRESEGVVASTGMSARATAAALRGVPAQITDIVTSLQGGQAPLTVFLQQGGQLRDMFGSAGGAARALGSAVGGMINPVNLAAAAVAIAAIAYNQGSKEADAYRKSLILTGNAVGVTSSQLATMAKQASLAAGTQGANAEALAQLVGTGKVGADQLVRASASAVQAQKYLGIEVSETVKAFSDLGRDPLQATLKLNDQYNYLTLSTYSQIKALTEQGKTTEAAKVAQEAFGKAQVDMADKAKAALGPYEKAWSDLGGAAKSAWDFMLNIGREDTLDEKIASAKAKLEKAKNAYYSFSGGSNSDKDADKAEAQRQLDRLQNQKKVAEMTAQYTAEDNKSRDAAVKFDQEGEKYLSQKLKIEKEVTAARNLGLQAAQRGEDPAVTEANIQTRIKAIRASYADYYNQSIESQIAAVTRLGDAQEEQAKRAFIPVQARQDAGLNKALDQQFAYIDAVADKDVAALSGEKSRLQVRLALAAQEVVSDDGQAKQKEKLAALRADIAIKDSQIATRRAQQESEIFVLDKKNTDSNIASSKALKDSRDSELVALNLQIKAQEDANALIGKSPMEIAAVTAALQDEAASRMEGNAAILDTIMGREDEAEALRKSAAAMRELAGLKVDGARLDAEKKFNDDLIAEQKKTVEKYNDIFRTGFADMLNNGKSGWASFTKSLTTTFKTSVADQIYKMFAQPFVMKLVASLIGVTGSAAATAAGSVAGAAGTGLGIAGTIGSIGSGAFQTAGALMAGDIGFGSTLSAGFSAIATGTASGLTAGFASVVGALGPIALGIGAAVSIWKSMDNSGTYHTGGAASASAAGVNTIRAESLNFEATQVSTQGQEFVNGLASGIVSILDGTASAFGKTAGYTAATAFADDTSKDGAWGGLVISKLGAKVLDWQDTKTGSWAPKTFSDGDAGKAEYLAALSSSVRTALDDIGLPSWAGSMLDALGTAPTIEKLTATVNTIVATQSALATLGDRLVGFAGMSDAAASALMAASGGIDKLAANASTYYDRFYNDGEKAAAVTKSLSASLAAVGLALPKTDADFRALVEAQMGLGEAGARAVSVLLANAGAFADLTASSAQATAATKAQSDATAALTERADLQKQLDELTMSSAQLLAQQRNALDSSNRALFDQVQAATNAKAATEAYNSSVADARSALSSAYSREAGELQGLVSKYKDAAKAARAYGQSLIAGQLSPLSDDVRLSVLKKQFEKAKPEDLQGAASAYLELLKTQAGSDLEYMRGFTAVQAAIDKSAKVYDSQAAFARDQLSALDASVAGIVDVADKQQTTNELLERYLSIVSGGVKAAGGGSTSSVATAWNGSGIDVGGGTVWDSMTGFHPAGTQSATTYVSPITTSASGAPTTVTMDTTELRKEIETLGEKLKIVLEKIEESTSRTSETLRSGVVHTEPA